MPAGSVLIYLGGLWHGGGASPTDGPARAAARVRGVVAAAPGDPARGRAARGGAWLPERLQELLGYNAFPPFSATSTAATPTGSRSGQWPGRRRAAAHPQPEHAPGGGAAWSGDDTDTDPGAGGARLADEYWEARLEASPLFATFLGDHRYDDRVDDLSAEAERRYRDVWADLRARAAALGDVVATPSDGGGGGGGGDGLSEVDRSTLDLLVHELDDTMRGTDLRLAEMASDQLDGVHAELLVNAGQLNNARARARRHGRRAHPAVRHDAGPGGRPVPRGAGRRAHARPHQHRAVDQPGRGLPGLDRRVRPLRQPARPGGLGGLDAWRAELAGIMRRRSASRVRRLPRRAAQRAAAVARPTTGRVWCTSTTARPCQALIEMHTGLPLTPGELHAVGMAEVTEALPAEYAEVGGRQFGTNDLQAIFARLVDDPALRYRDGDEIMAHAGACLEAARAAMGDWFGITPQAPCVLTPVPDYLAPDSPSAYYATPDGSRPGEYHVNLRGHGPWAGRDRGHGLPRGHPRAPPPARHRHRAHGPARLPPAVVGPPAFVEGWALYTERLADEMGLCASDLDRLGMLAADSWRACRLVVDTGLHAGVDSPPGHRLHGGAPPVSRAEIEVEVDRYIGIPGQALAYKVGQREILRLRAEAQGRTRRRLRHQGLPRRRARRRHGQPAGAAARVALARRRRRALTARPGGRRQP